jgi:hypothetical protein
LPIGLISSLNRAEDVPRSELTVRIYKDLGATRGRCSTDSLDKRGSDIRIADPDGVALACHTANVVADIYIIIACGQVGTGDGAQGRIEVTRVVKKRYVTAGCVAVSGTADCTDGTDELVAALSEIQPAVVDRRYSTCSGFDSVLSA